MDFTEILKLGFVENKIKTGFTKIFCRDLMQISEWLPGTYGKFPERNIVIENIDVQITESHGLSSYIEIQTTGAVVTRRKSSAVFVIREEKVFWLHLIENWF